MARVDVADADSLRRDPFFCFATYCLARATWVLEDSSRARELQPMLQPYADRFGGIATVGFGPMRMALAWTSAAGGELDEADRHFDAALRIADANGWRTVRCEALLHRAISRRERGDRDEGWLPLLDEAEELARSIGLDAMAGEVAAARSGERPSRLPASAIRLQRAKAKLSGRARTTLAALVRGDDDETLVRRFGTPTAQRVVCTALTAAYQPSMALGFEGEIEIEIIGIDPIQSTSDVWTLVIGQRGMSAEPRPARRPDLSVRCTIPDLIRLGTGAVSPTQAIVEGQITVEGDVVLAARLPYLFGVEAD